jgi:hypothetical protein
MLNLWRFETRHGISPAYQRTTALSFYWRFQNQPFPELPGEFEVPAAETLLRWYGSLSADSVALDWFVDAIDVPAPFVGDQEGNFLDQCTWPMHGITGYPLNWLALPVSGRDQDPAIQLRRDFLQSALQWKPSALQARVHIPTLLLAAGLIEAFN